MKSIKWIWIAAAYGLVASGCSGDNIFGDRLFDMKMTVSLGAVSGATCNVEGISGAILSQVVTGPDGTANVIDVPTSQFPVVLVCQGGTYFDEATGQTLDLDGEIKSLVPDARTLESIGSNVAVTALTDMAATLFQTLPPDDRDPISAIASLNSVRLAVAPSLGRQGQDILTAPQVVNQNNSSISGNTLSAQYAAYLAGISGAARASNQTTSELLQAFRDDLTDGDISLNKTATQVSQIVSQTQAYLANHGDADAQAAVAFHITGSAQVDSPKTDSGAVGGS